MQIGLFEKPVVAVRRLRDQVDISQVVSGEYRLEDVPLVELNDEYGHRFFRHPDVLEEIHRGLLDDLRISDSWDSHESRYTERNGSVISFTCSNPKTSNDFCLMEIRFPGQHNVNVLANRPLGAEGLVRLISKVSTDPLTPGYATLIFALRELGTIKENGKEYHPGGSAFGRNRIALSYFNRYHEPRALAVTREELAHNYDAEHGWLSFKYDAFGPDRKAVDEHAKINRQERFAGAYVKLAEAREKVLSRMVLDIFWGLSNPQFYGVFQKVEEDFYKQCLELQKNIRGRYPPRGTRPPVELKTERHFSRKTFRNLLSEAMTVVGDVFAKKP